MGGRDSKEKMRHKRRLLSRYDEGAQEDARRVKRHRVEKARKAERREINPKSAERKEEIKAIAKKNHRVKFFERIKIERKMKKVVRALAEKPEDSALLEQKEKLLDDLRYVRFFPHHEPYFSLFKENKTKEEQKLEYNHRRFARGLAKRTSRGKDEALLAFLDGSKRKRKKIGLDQEEETKAESAKANGNDENDNDDFFL